MPGFNLPPGVTVSDIPGNSAADVRYAQLYEGTYERLLDGDLATELSEPEARELLESLVCWIVPEPNEGERNLTQLMARLLREVERAAKRKAEELTEAYLDADDRR